MRRILTRMLPLFVLLLPVSVLAQNVIDINDASMVGDITWTNDNIYRITGRVFVEDGETLTIEPGTVIWGAEGDGSEASVLVVARGGKIYARGTRRNPIIFTADGDDVNDPSDILPTERGLWGGLIVLGKARINTAAGSGQIEGIDPTEPRGQYGGDNDEDNSGEISYVSIRHGGISIGADNEINGLTLGAVGSKTVLHHIEIYANLDDGIEWFGGTANVKYAVAAFCGDDGYDYDEGWRGKGQFWFSINSPEKGGSAGEHDGGTNPETGEPYAIPTIYNATYVGSGVGAPNAKNTPALHFRDNAGGKYYNSIVTDFEGKALRVEDLAPEKGDDSRVRYENGDLVLANNLWWGFGGATTLEDFIDNSENDDATWPATLAASIISNNNQIVDPQLTKISRTDDGSLDPRPADGSPAWDDSKIADRPEDDDFFETAPYFGAFGRINWLTTWTGLEHYGYVTPDPQNIVDVNDGDIDGDVTWTSDNIYRLNGLVFVDEGESITIDPGTVIWGAQGENSNASALVIARGAKIFANGTEDEPIIFTAEGDDITDPTDILPNERGLWGGLIILGRAGLNTAAETGQIEGIDPTEPRGAYGGTNDNDNSGVVTYVSIRHGGISIGADNEINGLTLGGVGDATRLEHIEVFANLDDGIEWFGGTANVKWAAVAFCGDDSYDYDEGWRGKGQFWFSLSASDRGNSAGEHDGGTNPETGQPYAIPTIYNATYIGSGAASSNAKNTPALHFRDNAGGKYYNSIFTDYFDKALRIEDLDPGKGDDSRVRYENDDLELANNLWWNFGGGANLEALIDNSDNDDAGWPATLATALNDDNNEIADPKLRGISRNPDNVLDPRPDGNAGNNPALDADRVRVTPTDGFFTSTSFMGAFGNQLWLRNWTALDDYGYLSDDEPGGVVEVRDGELSDNEVWTSNNIYRLNGRVFVEDGQTLTIEAGTVIWGAEGENSNASALIIARGAKIFANGTKERPIIFTADGDDVNDPTDVLWTERGLWGGLMILGKARTNTATGTGQIEGIDPTEPRGEYGGDDDNDNSGVVRYVSIRHGGISIGADNEINGLTLGAVGSETVIQNVEIYSNLDDGIEWFGGTANVKWAAVVFSGDDAFDYDEGWRGKGQFWLSLAAGDRGNSAGEHDGGTNPETGQPYAIPTIYNATYIGSGANSSNAKNTPALHFRDNAGGKYYNSIVTDYFDKALRVEDLAPEKGDDSRIRMEQGDLVLSNNIWWNFGGGTELPALIDNSENDDANWPTTLAATLVSSDNWLVDPQLRSINRGQGFAFDPRPLPGSPALTNARQPLPAGDDFYSSADFIGAFGTGQNWIAGWTALTHYSIVTGVEERYSEEPTAGAIAVNSYPNPVSNEVTVRLNLPNNGRIDARLIDLQGRTVKLLVNNKVKTRGSYEYIVDTSQLSAGSYYVQVTTETGTVNQTITVLR